MKKIRDAVLCVLAVLAFTGVFFQPAFATDDAALPSPINPFLKTGYARIGLTEAQIAAMRAVGKKNLPGIKASTEQIREQHRQLKSLIHAIVSTSKPSEHKSPKWPRCRLTSV